MDIDLKNVKIGQWATYFDAGIWTLVDGAVVAPEDLTISQLKDFLLAGGGAVYLRKDGKLCWIASGRRED